MLVLLDSKPLGMATNPNATEEATECSEWLEGLLAKGIEVRVPEIIDYELRRELVRANKIRSVKKLDSLGESIGYIPVDTDTLRKAAELWAMVRNLGKQTASELALDIDCILAAQAIKISGENEETIIATIDVDDLTRYNTPTVTAMLWSDVK